MRVCKKCGQYKPDGEFYFQDPRKTKKLRRNVCKECLKEYSRLKYKEKNSVKVYFDDGCDESDVLSSVENFKTRNNTNTIKVLEGSILDINQSVHDNRQSSRINTVISVGIIIYLIIKGIWL